MNRMWLLAGMAVGVLHGAASGDVIKVGPGGSIQAAIDASQDGDEIVVAQGEYFENINFLGKAITVRSTDPNNAGVVMATIINGGGLGSVVSCDSSETANTIIRGFTISGGAGGNGGGMRCGTGAEGPSSPTVIDCWFIANTSMAGGGGGMRISGGSCPMVINCIFAENAADYGGGARIVDSDPTFINCVFLENSAVLGGGAISNEAASPTFINCTVSGNTSALGGAMFNTNFSLPIVINSILRGNAPDQVFDDVALTTVVYSNLEDGWPGIGNIDTDPLFLDPNNGDYRLHSASPCIDAAHNWAIAGVADTDLDGNPRFAADKIDFDTGCGIPVIVDMGAYEFQGDPFPVKLGDLDGDGVVGINDFLDLLGEWGSCTEACCLADLDLDETVGIADFLILLGNWG